MAIWLDELEREGRAALMASLRDRRDLRRAVERRHLAAHDHPDSEAVLLLLEVEAREAEDNVESELLARGLDVLRNELLQRKLDIFTLRTHELALLSDGPADLETLKRLVALLKRKLDDASDHRLRLAYGAARATEAHRHYRDWLALADQRLQGRSNHLEWQALRPTGIERRRTGRH